MSEGTLLYITKYDNKIKVGRASRDKPFTSGLFRVYWSGWSQTYKLGVNCFLSEEEAIANFRARQRVKIKQAQEALSQAEADLAAPILFDREGGQEP